MGLGGLRRAGGVLLACGMALTRWAALAETDAPVTEALHAYTTPEEKRDVADLILGAGVTVGGLIEVEASAGRDGGESASDITLATVELGVAAEPTDWVRGNAVLLWEEDDTEPVDLDVATITLGGGNDLRGFLEIGKLYVPFGAFNSHMVSDPLVLELGETRETAAVAGFDNGILALKVGAFNGDMDDGGDDDEIDDAAAALTFTPAEGVSFGVYWISDIGESDGLGAALRESVDGAEASVVVDEDGEPAVEPGAPGVPYGKAGGTGAFVSLQCGSFALEVEGTSALDDFGPGLLADDAMRPRAWNVELAWAVSEHMELAGRYEGSDEFPGMPEMQYGPCVTFGLADRATIACEYLHGEYEGDGGCRDAATAQLAVEF